MVHYQGDSLFWPCLQDPCAERFVRSRSTRMPFACLWQMCYTPDDDGAAVFRESAMATKTDAQASTKAKAAKSAQANKPAKAQARPRTQRTRLAGVRQLIVDVRSEIKKVTWPDRETTRNLTLIVIGLSAILGLLLGGVDALFVRLWDLIHAL